MGEYFPSPFDNSVRQTYEEALNILQQRIVSTYSEKIKGKSGVKNKIWWIKK